MITPEIKAEYSKLYQLVLVVDEIIKKQAQEIYQLPPNERKPYLDEHFPIKDYIDESYILINSILLELDKRPTTQQYEQTKKLLTAARQYIKVLGGNPSLITFS
jgi:hypothetical protein